MMAGLKPGFLASVRNVAEAEMAATLGAELIDLKEPRHGALGAVPEAEQRRIMAALGQQQARPRPMVSATVGDLPFDAEILAAAIVQTQATGVDIVKFGVFASGKVARQGFAELDRRLRNSPPGAQLVALLLADRMVDIDEAIALASVALQVQGIAGVMIDTAAKGTPTTPAAPAVSSTSHAPAIALPDIFSARDLARFVAAVHANGGFAGLAGCLGLEHIVSLVETGVDVLGFRGALCAGSRTDALDARCFAKVRNQLFAARARFSSTLCPA
jgi:uncharacterized protein (UPF0264 family)